MTERELLPLSHDELAAEVGTTLPAKEVISLLDLQIDLDLGIDLAAPIDLAVAANANVAAPIDAAVGANLLSVDSKAATMADQKVQIGQNISGAAIATSNQDSVLDQSNDVVDPGTSTPAAGTPAPAAPAGTSVEAIDPNSLLTGDLLNVDVNVSLDADVAAPIAGAVAANANVAAPIDAAVAANVGSVGSEATAVAKQDAVIIQNMEDVVAEATADQRSDIRQ
ncbi:MAG TPA: hypothetical protein VNV66_03805 [Pilimelia sp.]|nr:hypothetical protein [Pilimelia sp.]